MSSNIYKTAAEVISQATPQKPADSVLRTVLRNKTALSRPDGREISWTVFNYYRWLRWLDAKVSLEEQIVQARDWAWRFRQEPGTFSAEDLAKAAPDWAPERVGASPEWLRALQVEPTIWLRARRGTAQNLLSRFMIAQPGPLPDSIRFQSEEDLFRLPEFHEGLFELQDISSQAVSLICDPKPGETWWDACAGEGGKTLHLSDLMGNKGMIWATDKADWRLKQLKLRAGRAHCFNYRSKPWAGTGTLPTKTLFDGVLLDAPCSGIGTWQRNPHARWTTTPQDLDELAALQQSLLSQVSASVKPGARLIYAVCTLSLAETRDIADNFEKEHPEFLPCPFANPFDSAASLANRLTLWPQHVGGNGMFIAAWRKEPKK